MEFPTLFRPFRAGLLLASFTHGVAVGFLTPPLTGLQANAGCHGQPSSVGRACLPYVGQAFQPACGTTCRFSALLRPVGAGISLANLTHGVAVGFLTPPLTGLQANASTLTTPSMSPASAARHPMNRDNEKTAHLGIQTILSVLICVHLWFHSLLGAGSCEPSCIASARKPFCLIA